MLRSDGLSRAQFMPLWRDAVWHAVDPGERARLLLELGRVIAREEGRAEPLLVAVSARRDPPLTVLALPEAPEEAAAPGVRAHVRERLAELGATECYLLLTLAVGGSGGVPTLLLAAWGETLEGEEACWMQAFRWAHGALEEAPPVCAPDPERTEISRRCRGLLTAAH